MSKKNKVWVVLFENEGDVDGSFEIVGVATKKKNIEKLIMKDIKANLGEVSEDEVTREYTAIRVKIK